MGPWSCSQLLTSDTMAWAVRQATMGGREIPTVICLDQLAERVGMTRKQLFRILAGESSPTVAQFVTLCRAIGSARAVAALAEECGLVVVGGLVGPMEPTAVKSHAGDVHAIR